MSGNLRDRLEEIRRKRGTLTPAVVLDEARDPAHPLHHRFEWDDGVAAERWRRHQAHELIVSVRVKYADRQDKLTDVRAFQAIRREDGYRYEPVESVVEDEIATRIVLADMEREWKQLYRRYAAFKEFTEMVRRDVDAA